MEKFTSVIREASANEAQRSDLAQLFDRSVADGRATVMSGRMDCQQADRRLADLEQSLNPSGPASSPAPGPAAAPAPVFAATQTAIAPAANAVRGVTDREIRFGITAAFTGPVKERGRQMKLGIETAFNRVNDAGGVGGRMLRIIAADDGNEPTRTREAMRQLYERDQVFGIIGNIGTATAAAAVPYLLERRMLFFGAYTGGNVVRRDPPDRYVFNYRPSYAEEADAAVRYLVKLRRIPVRQIAVFAQRTIWGMPGTRASPRRFAHSASTTAPSCGSATRETPSMSTMRSICCKCKRCPSRRSSWPRPTGPRQNSSRRRATSIPT